MPGRRTACGRGYPALAVLGGLLASAPIAGAAALSRQPAAWVLAAAVAAFAGCEALVSPEGDRAGSLADAAGSLATALLLLAIWVGAALTATTRAPLLCAGASLFAAGAALRIAAIRTLGDRFRSCPRAAPAADLETAGVYRRMRHPSELGTLFLAGGAALMTGSALAAAALAALAALIAARTAAEDRQLALAFGDRYLAYRQSVRWFGWRSV